MKLLRTIRERLLNFAGLGLLNRFIDLSSTVTEAISEAREVTARLDVPSVVETRDGRTVAVPMDLWDKKPRFFGLASGYTIAGKLLPEDRGDGSDSSATPLLIIAFPVLTAIISLFFAVDPLLGAALAVLMGLPAYTLLFIALRQCEDSGEALKAFGLGVVLPFSGMLTLGMFPGLSIQALLSNPAILGVPFTLALIAFAVALLFGGRLGGQRAVLWTGLVLAAVVASLILPGVLSIIPFYVLGCFQAYMFAYNNRMTRAIELQRQFLANEAELFTKHITDSAREARHKQAVNAAMDDSPFIEYGKALGVLSLKRDGYAPDEGMPLGQTINDLSTHFIAWGPTGAGKTSGTLRPIVKAISEAGGSYRVGMLLMDGKGSLPAEMRALVDVMIEPGQQFNLIEGLSATSLVAAILEISVDAKQREGNSAFWVTSAEQMFRHFAVFYEAYIQNLERLMILEGGDYQWNLASMWTVFQMLRMVTTVDRGLENSDAATELVAELATGVNPNFPDLKPEDIRHPDVGKGGLLDAAIEYIQTFPKTMGDDKTLSNVWSTLQSWIDPLMAHEDLIPWSRCVTGLDPTDCCRGKRVGVNVPAHEYGTAGRLVQSLVKQRVTNKIKRRGGDKDWDKRGDQTQVIIMIDECQELITQTETTMLPIARSLGAYYVMATQNIDGLFAKIGRDATNQFCDNFRSWNAAGEVSEATLHWISQRLGIGSVYSTGHTARAIDYDTTLKALAGSPLHDPTHELARELRHLKRAGAGLLSHGAGANKDSGKWSGQKLRTNDTTNALYEQVLSTGGFVEGPWLTPLECYRFLAEPNIAIAQVMRGGVKRRDVIVLNPIFEVKKKVEEGVDESQTVSNVEGVETTSNIGS
ncbi:MAG: TraM recognition domain-containing protein [Lysobacteraceae bacterium]